MFITEGGSSPPCNSERLCSECPRRGFFGDKHILHVVISRPDVDYIMETFPIVKRKDEAKHGEYLTKRVILEMYDQMANLPIMSVPAPKDDSATYDVPDLSQ